MDKLVIGIDYGTDSCRALIIDSETGAEKSQHISYYPRWSKNLYCNPSKNQYRQHPQDYIYTLEQSIKGALSKISKNEQNSIVALGIDTTGSTPCLTDKNGIPLALLSKYKDNPNAMFILWKDHSSLKEADEINNLSHNWGTDFTSRSGGIYTSEWFWAKALHVLREDETIREDAYSIIEHCDWMPAILTGNIIPEKVKRSRCAAGHKGMWAEEWGGYPSQEFLSSLDPLLNDFVSHLGNTTYTSDMSAGKLVEEWADRLGLPKGIDVAVGIIDAHSGAIGAGIKINTMVKIVGTSTCDIIVTPKKKLIPGISGQVDGSVIPGLIGIEAGQSAFGDIYAWFRNLLSWTFNLIPNFSNKEDLINKILPKLTEEAKKIPVEQTTLLSNDWFNGKRSPYVDLTLKGKISGLTLGTTAPEIFKSLVEATAMGSKAILDHLGKEGIIINEVISVGGISLKSPYVMQTLSDVMQVPIKIAASNQTVALGAAICATVSAKIFNTVEESQRKLCKGFQNTYTPNKDYENFYNEQYEKYLSSKI